MKNVLIIIGKLIIGGAERVGRDIGYYADKKKYRIHYLVFEDEKCAYEKELTDAVLYIIWIRRLPDMSDITGICAS